ncbi:MAG TPA: sodium:solute symporter family protein [Desulfomonilaceae bacterium]|nr:sodium:solute symporter family protein [Desulfomonilaceae bacterium]
MIWTYIAVCVTFALYIFISWRSMVNEAKGFYVAGMEMTPLATGMATAADWMSAASFLSMAGIISFAGYAGSVYIMGWTGGYVLLALLLAPYLRKFGKFTVPDFVGDRYYSDTARMIALICAIVVSFIYVCGQLRGVAIIFSRFLEVEIHTGVVVGMVVALLYSALGGMKGITWTQVAQYVVIVIGFLIPAILVSGYTTGIPIPQIALGATISQGGDAGKHFLEALNKINTDLGFSEFTAAFGAGQRSMLDVVCVTFSLMLGTVGLPHVIIRYYGVASVNAARLGAAYALLFIALLYTTVPAVAAFGRYGMIESINGQSYQHAPSWFKEWERTGLVAWMDKNGDGKIQYRAGEPFEGRPMYTGGSGNLGQRLVSNKPTSNANEVYIDPDIMVLAIPEIASLPPWVAALVVAGGLAAALSTVAGLLLVIASSVSHDLYYRLINPRATDKEQLRLGRVTMGITIIIAGYFGLYPPALVAEVVAYAFGLAASSFFPVMVLGIFWSRTTREGAIWGMLTGILFTGLYIFLVKFLHVRPWLFGISAQGIGAVGMIINFVVTVVVSLFTPQPPEEVQELVESVRTPSTRGDAFRKSALRVQGRQR